MSGEKHKQHRRLIQPAFLHGQIEKYGQDMASITELLADEWRGRTRIDINTEMKVNASPLRHYSVFIILK